jgi:hypothetical protein
MPTRLAASNDYRDFRNKIFKVLLQKDGVEFISLAEGSPSAEKPEEFWDIQLSINGLRIGIDVHAGSQNWIRDSNKPVDFCARASQMTKSIDGKSFVVFDKADESSEDWKEFTEIVSALNRANQTHEITLIVGDSADAVAEKIVNTVLAFPKAKTKV